MDMGESAERLLTFEELYEAIESLRPGLTGEILAPGTIRVMGRPGRKHRLASRRVLRGLAGGDLAEGGAGWWFEVEAEIRLGDGLLVPDLSGWRVGAEPDFIENNPILVPPDWVCEILSRSTQRGDRVEKLPMYEAARVEHAWIVDPIVRTVEVYALKGGNYQLVATARGADPVVLPPFEALMPLGTWWSTKTPG